MRRTRSLSDTETTPIHQWIAGLLLAGLGAITCWSLAANPQWPKLTSFMPTVVVAIAIVELITAVMLIAQFFHTRKAALAWLAAAYLFAGSIVIPFALTFPEAFSPTGLFNAGPQTTTWMWLFWHAGFPALVLGYVVQLRRTAEAVPERNVPKVIASMTGGILILVAGLSTLAIAGHDLLPRFYAAGNYSGITTSGIGPAIAALCAAAIAGLWWRSRFACVLDLWLGVALAAFLLDIVGVLGGRQRYTAAWYIARLNGLVSAFTVLAVFLIEVNALYARLSAAAERTASDNDRLRQAEAELAARREMLQTAFDGVNEGICAFDHDLRLVAWNRRYFDMFRYPPDFAQVGMPYETLVRFNAERGEYGPGDVEEQVRERVTALARFEPHYFERTRPNGTVIAVEGNPIPSDGIVRTFTEITERKRMETDLRAAKSATEEQLAQAQKMEALGHLTGGLAHDFNNLLSVVIGNLDLLLDSPGEGLGPQSGSRALAETALEAALKGGELTRQLLAFARRQPLQPKTIDVNELVGTTVKLLSRTLGEQMSIVTELAPDGLWPVVADPSLLESAIVNIATNARDAMPDGGTLTIRTANTELDEDYAAMHGDVRAGEYTILEISDTGTGMPPDLVARVFEPFFTTKPVGRGTGLGLSMVYGFVKQSGGHIKIYSEMGHGTVIRLYLPRAAEDGRTTLKVDRDLRVTNGGELILAVDDNPQMRETVVKQLSFLGYRTLEAENAAAALDVLEHEDAVDLLFTDLVMPGGMSGQDLARQAREKHPQLKVLFTSGFPDVSRYGFTLDPAESLLSKPYRKTDLASKVREVLDA